MGSVSVDSEQDGLFSNLEEEFLAAEDNERENENDNTVDTDLDSLFGDAADDDLHSLFSESEDGDQPQQEQKEQHEQPPGNPPSRLQHHASDHTPPKPGPVELTLPLPSASTTTGTQPSQQPQDQQQQQQPLSSQDLPTPSLDDLTPDELELLEAITPPFTDGHEELLGQQEGQCMPSAPDPPASPFSLQDGHTSGGPAVSTQTPSDLPPEPALSLESLDWMNFEVDEADIEAAIAQMERPQDLLNGMVDQVSDSWQGEGSQQQPQQQPVSQNSFESLAQASVSSSSPPVDNSLPQAQEPYVSLPRGHVSQPQANDQGLLTPPASSQENTPPAPVDNQYIRVSEIPGFRYSHCYTNRGATITRRVDLHPNQLPILLDYITLGKFAPRSSMLWQASY